MHANTKQSMEEWIDIFTAAAALRGDDRVANELMAEVTIRSSSLTAMAKHQAATAGQSVATGLESAATKTSGLFLSCCRRNDADAELWAAPFNANIAAANSSGNRGNGNGNGNGGGGAGGGAGGGGGGAGGAAAAGSPGAATHNPMQLLPQPAQSKAHRAPMGAGQPIPRNVHNRNPFLHGGGGGGGGGQQQQQQHGGQQQQHHRSVVNPLRPLQHSGDSDGGGSGGGSRITHNPMKMPDSSSSSGHGGGGGGLMRQGYVLPDVSEDVDEDDHDDDRGGGGGPSRYSVDRDREDNV